MLIIGGSDLTSSPFIKCALSSGRPFRQLRYWEQIERLDNILGSSILEVDGMIVDVAEPVILLSRPRFALNCLDSGDRDFAWSEWSAALDAFLYDRRHMIPNGRVLIGRHYLADDKTAYCPEMSRVTEIRTGVRNPEHAVIWALLCKGFVANYPAHVHCEALGQRQHLFFQFLQKHNLDFCFVRCQLAGDDLELTEVHLMPSDMIPPEALSAFFAIFGETK